MADGALNEKGSLRETMRSFLQGLATEHLFRDTQSKLLAERLAHSKEWNGASEIVVFASMAIEIDTAPLIAAAGASRKAIAVPRVGSKGLSFHYVDGRTTELKPGYRGIPEPASSATELELSSMGADLRSGRALLLCPGLAFDTAGHRIGWGGGYYDRVLETIRGDDAGPPRGVIAVGYDEQIVSSIPTDEHDELVWAICTPHRFVYCT